MKIPNLLYAALFLAICGVHGNLGVAVCPPEEDHSIHEINTFLTDWNQTQKRLGGLARSCALPETPQSPIHFLRARRWPIAACQPYASVESVCRIASSYCRDQGTTATCWFGLGRPTPCIPEAQLLQSHRDTIQYASRRFHELTRNQDLQNHCCGNNQPCRQKWRSTRLNLILGLGAQDQTARYNRSKGAVEVSLGILVNCTTEDCIERIFYHELGHACARARPRDPQTALAGFTTPRVAECIMRGLETQRQQAIGPVDFDSWINEALADSIFISRASVWPAGWGWSCNVTQDENHANPRAFLGCYLDIPSVHQNICGR